MATDGPTPPACDREIFEQGMPIARVLGSSNRVERWVRSVAKAADVRIDWHYSGGVAQILCLGDEDALARACEALERMAPELEGQFDGIIPHGHPGLYRQGITPMPDNAICVAEETAVATTFMVAGD